MTATLSHTYGRTRTGTPPERFTSTSPDDFAVPRGREEEWRFTPLRYVRPLLEPFQPSTRIAGSVEVADGVRWEITPPTDPRVGRVLQPADRISALAFVGAPQAFVLQIPPEATVPVPILVHGVAEPGEAYEHMVIEAGAHARATVIIDYTGSATVAENVEIIVGESADLTVVSVQTWDADAIHVSTHAAAVGQDATLHHTLINLGGRVVRVSPTVRFTGRGARAELIGLSFAATAQHQEARLYVDHSQPDCTSNVLYKNALQGNGARTVWIGDVRIRPQATGTDTFEMNRNLLLTDGARADSVPNLEIETGAILRAGHASATGRFDDEQMFYLKSRGIPEHAARRLVVRGFFADVIKRIGVPELEERLTASIEQRLDDIDTPDDSEQ